MSEKIDCKLRLNKLEHEVQELLGVVLGVKPDYTESVLDRWRWVDLRVVTAGGLKPRNYQLQSERTILKEIVGPEVQALRKKVAEKDEAEAALRREVKELREKLEHAQKAVREKDEEVEEAYRVFRKVVGSSATSLRSSDAPTPRRDDVSTSKERSFAPYPYYPPGGYPTPMVEGNPRTLTEKHWAEKQRQDAIDFGKGFKR
jgi:seryl-tRNA synthetase